MWYTPTINAIGQDRLNAIWSDWCDDFTGRIFTRKDLLPIVAKHLPGLKTKTLTDYTYAALCYFLDETECDLSRIGRYYSVSHTRVNPANGRDGWMIEGLRTGRGQSDG